MTSTPSLFGISGKLAALLVAALSVTPALGAAAPWQSGEAKQDGKHVVITQLIGGDKGGSFLGVGVREIDAERAREKNVPEERGVEITSVVEDSAAEKAGLQKGDVVLEYNGQRVEGVEQFIRLVRETPVGRQATIQVSRDGSMETVTATIGTKKTGVYYKKGGGKYFRIPDIRIPHIRIPDIPHVFTTWHSRKLGIEAESLESQLAEYFGVEEGVLVRSVMKGSAAEKAGLRAGDVILKAGDTEVTTPREVTSVIREMESDTFPLTIMREKRERTLTVTIEDGPDGNGSLRGTFVYDRGTRL